MGNRTRQKNKRGDSKVESNDSPEIPDRGETSDTPGLPSWHLWGRSREILYKTNQKQRLAQTLTWAHSIKKKRKKD